MDATSVTLIADTRNRMGETATRPMSKPKAKRCEVCKCVTSRYVRTQDAGAFVVQVWARDPRNGEVSTVNGTVIRCTEHAEAQR